VNVIEKCGGKFMYFGLQYSILKNVGADMSLMENDKFEL